MTTETFTSRRPALPTTAQLSPDEPELPRDLEQAPETAATHRVCEVEGDRPEDMCDRDTLAHDDRVVGVRDPLPKATPEERRRAEVGGHPAVPEPGRRQIDDGDAGASQTNLPL